MLQEGHDDINKALVKQSLVTTVLKCLLILQ